MTSFINETDSLWAYHQFEWGLRQWFHGSALSITYVQRGIVGNESDKIRGIHPALKALYGIDKLVVHWMPERCTVLYLYLVSTSWIVVCTLITWPTQTSDADFLQCTWNVLRVLYSTYFTHGFYLFRLTLHFLYRSAVWYIVWLPFRPVIFHLPCVRVKTKRST